MGINHYLTSNRYLDTDLHRYPPEAWGTNGRHEYADVAAVRVLDDTAGLGAILAEAWERYRIPLAVTEVHLGCTREEQMRWLRQAWDTSAAIRNDGVDVRAVTAWALLGSFDWDSLLTRHEGHYEPGAFDVRGPQPRLTALGRMIGELTRASPPGHPASRGPGWWRSPSRFAYGHRGRSTLRIEVHSRADDRLRPIVVTGGRGTLGMALGEMAALRGLDARLLTRQDLDIADPAAVASVLAELNPWAVVNAAGYVRVDQAEVERGSCFRENADGPATLARECGRLGITAGDVLLGPGICRKHRGDPTSRATRWDPLPFMEPARSKRSDGWLHCCPRLW